MNPRHQRLAFWDAHARWQQTWLEHCHYHRPLLSVITAPVSPGWRVLDIGAGTGVLALPLRDRGCQVTALEPSAGMRALLLKAAGTQPHLGLTIDPRPWEDFPLAQAGGFDLILACNSLHLTSLGLHLALTKAFRCQPEHLCLITELDFLPQGLPLNFPDYCLTLSSCLLTDSSFAYHHPEELWEHFQHIYGRRPQAAEKTKLLKKLVYQEDHYWLKQKSLVALFWWSKITLH